ncbi:MAG: hypothetical protein LBQ59_03760 [Candidatus Peribacteria bacterium]|nr:hypothetical protein [Candidatus Peribacteria bacterium]
MLIVDLNSLSRHDLIAYTYGRILNLPAKYPASVEQEIRNLIEKIK